jgi:hypothetical protein
MIGDEFDIDRVNASVVGPLIGGPLKHDFEEEEHPSEQLDCCETESDVLTSMAEGEIGCPVCSLAPEEHPPA